MVAARPAQRCDLHRDRPAGLYKLRVMAGDEYDAFLGPGPELVSQHATSLLVQAVAATVCDDDGGISHGCGSQEYLPPRTRRHLFETLVQMRLQTQPVCQVQHGMIERCVFFRGDLLEQPAPCLG